LLSRKMSTAIKTSWADDVEELEQPKIEQDFVDENGIRTTIEYIVNDDGKKIKITRKTRRRLQKSLVDHVVAERKAWPKFGLEKGNKPGPDRGTTTVGEEVSLSLRAGGKTTEEAEPTPEEKMRGELAKAGAGKVVCRLCRGGHFTAKCPYKDSLPVLEGTETPPFPGGDDTLATPEVPSNSLSTGPGKYVPPSMRGAGGIGRGAGESMRGNRDDLPTLRVTNISEDTQEQDLRDLFSHVGRVARVYVGRDRETGIGKGFAFVSFEDRAVAQRAIERMNGRGYDNLILSVGWSQPREQR